MNKRKLYESIMKKISKTVKRALLENDELVHYYRGYERQYGSRRNHLLWLTDDIEYASEYGDTIDDIIVNDNELKPVSIDEIEDIINAEYDYIQGPTKKQAQLLLNAGYNCHCFYIGDYDSYCICLWDDKPIVSIRQIENKDNQ